MFHTSQVVIIPTEAVTEEDALPSTSTEHGEVMSSPVKTRKRNDKLLVKALRLRMKQQERKMDILRRENKRLTSVLSSRPMKRLKEKIIQRDRKIMQLKQELTPQRTNIVNARRRSRYQSSIYRAKVITTKKVDHDEVIGQLTKSENTIMELQETIEKLQTPSHTMREGI